MWAGNDTVYLIKNNWNVLAIDRESVEERIAKRLNNEELEKFRFQKQNFESLELEKNNLIVANYCLPFCNKNNFKELCDKINHSILKDGYFVGNFFGDNDEWKSIKEEMTFLTKEQVIELFKDFDIEMMADKSMTKQELLSVLEEFYTPEKQKQYGVVGIRIEKI